MMASKPVAMVPGVFVIVLCGLGCVASALNATVSAASSVREFMNKEVEELYSTNALCSKNNCINPIFPGMEDLHRLEDANWISRSLTKVQPKMSFCRGVVDYDPALPIPSKGRATLEEMVQAQETSAATMFNYHLSGMGIDAWDHQEPANSNDCIRSIWRMTCFTYFPRTELGSQDGARVKYMRPCQSSCQNYVKACGVSCCDESVQCVFSHTKKLSNKRVMITQGYSPHDGPSSLCTGGARRAATPLGAGLWALLALTATSAFDGAFSSRLLQGMARRSLWMGLLAAIAVSLQGCDYDVPVHKVGNWRAEPDYLLRHTFIPPGGNANSATLNSCSLQRLSSTLQCNGRGVCKLWDQDNLKNDLAFCKCDTGWADPECRTKRKSQTVAYLLSLFFGFLGADEFYLGFIAKGFVKLLTLGGFGILWIVDIIRIGSAPVYATDYLVAADLPHFAYVLITTIYGLLMGFALAYYTTVKYRGQKRKEAMLLGLDEEARQKEVAKPFTSAYGAAVNMQQQQYGAVGQGNRQATKPVLVQEQGMGPGGMPLGPGGMPSMPMGSMPPTMPGMGPMPPSMPGGMMPSMPTMSGGPMPSVGSLGPVGGPQTIMPPVGGPQTIMPPGMRP